MVDWKEILIPTLVAGGVAGLSVVLTQLPNGWKAALVTAGITFLLTVLQKLQEYYSNKGTAVSVKKDGQSKDSQSKKKLKLFLGQ